MREPLCMTGEVRMKPFRSRWVSALWRAGEGPSATLGMTYFPYGLIVDASVLSATNGAQWSLKVEFAG